MSLHRRWLIRIYWRSAQQSGLGSRGRDIRRALIFSLEEKSSILRRRKSLTRDKSTLNIDEARSFFLDAMLESMKSMKKMFCPARRT